MPPIPIITELPEAPARTMAPDEFIPKADAFVAGMGGMPAELNAFGAYISALAASLGVDDASANVMALVGQVLAADKGLYATGPGALAQYNLTAFGRTLGGLADALALRTAAGVYSTAEVDALLTGGLRFKTATDCSGNPGYPAASKKGDAYIVSVAGKIGGAAGKNVDAGDWYIAIADNAGGTEAVSGASWAVIEHNVDSTLYVPTGAVQQFAMNAAPSGWLECNGAAVSRATYASLFAAIGTTHGVGDGATTFNLPDLRGEFVRGWDHGRGVDAGRAFGSAQADELKAHTHPAPSDPGSGGGTSFQSTGGTPVNINTGSTGGVETRPRNIALLYAIKT